MIHFSSYKESSEVHSWSDLNKESTAGLICTGSGEEIHFIIGESPLSLQVNMRGDISTVAEFLIQPGSTGSKSL